MKRRAHHVALTHEDTVALVRRKHLDARPGAFDPGRSDEDRRERRFAQRRNLECDLG
jgi:hypothetical protein